MWTQTNHSTFLLRINRIIELALRISGAPHDQTTNAISLRIYILVNIPHRTNDGGNHSIPAKTKGTQVNSAMNGNSYYSNCVQRLCAEEQMRVDIAVACWLPRAKRENIFSKWFSCWYRYWLRIFMVRTFRDIITISSPICPVLFYLFFSGSVADLKSTPSPHGTRVRHTTTTIISEHTASPIITMLHIYRFAIAYL